jgi:RNase P subunit RPR2
VSTQKIAEERIRILFSQAEKKFDSEGELSDRYVEIARNIGERTQVSVPSNLKKHFCSNCGKFWRHGANCSVRIDSENQFIRYTCENCEEEEKYGF